MRKWTLTQQLQTVNGIRIHVTQWGKLMIVHWDGSPIEPMPREAWFDLPTTIPEQAVDYLVPFQPVYRTCGNLYTYSIQCGTDKLRFYPRSGAITADDSISGQLITLAK